MQGWVVHSGVPRTVEYQTNLPDYGGRSSLKEIAALATNNTSNVNTVLNGRIDIEQYRASKVFRNFGRALNCRAFDLV